MPHRSQKKRQQQQPQKKRLEVTDDNGWTHVTTTGKARRAIKSSSSATNSVLAPAEAPRNISSEALERQFWGHRERWEGSESWRVVGGAIRRWIAEGEDNKKNRIDGIVCVGLGSPSGFLKGGWVDRRSVSMYQLAALVCVRDLVYGTFFSPFFCYSCVRFSILLSGLIS